MGSLYIKDAFTADRVARVAERLGITKTDAVRQAIEALEKSLPPAKPKQDFMEWIAEYRRKNPLPPPTGLKADKAFFDEMWDEL